MTERHDELCAAGVRQLIEDARIRQLISRGEIRSERDKDMELARQIVDFIRTFDSARKN